MGFLCKVSLGKLNACRAEEQGHEITGLVRERNSHAMALHRRRPRLNMHQPVAKGADNEHWALPSGQSVPRMATRLTRVREIVQLCTLVMLARSTAPPKVP